MCSRFNEGSPADLERLGIVDEVAGHERDRVFGRRRYLAILAQGTHRAIYVSTIQILSKRALSACVIYSSEQIRANAPHPR
jgi:hypothetical protein